MDCTKLFLKRSLYYSCLIVLSIWAGASISSNNPTIYQVIKSLPYPLFCFFTWIFLTFAYNKKLRKEILNELAKSHLIKPLKNLMDMLNNTIALVTLILVPAIVFLVFTIYRNPPSIILVAISLVISSYYLRLWPEVKDPKYPWVPIILVPFAFFITPFIYGYLYLGSGIIDVFFLVFLILGFSGFLVCCWIIKCLAISVGSVDKHKDFAYSILSFSEEQKQIILNNFEKYSIFLTAFVFPCSFLIPLTFIILRQLAGIEIYVLVLITIYLILHHFLIINASDDFITNHSCKTKRLRLALISRYSSNALITILLLILIFYAKPFLKTFPKFINDRHFIEIYKYLFSFLPENIKPVSAIVYLIVMIISAFLLTNIMKVHKVIRKYYRRLTWFLIFLLMETALLHTLIIGNNKLQLPGYVINGLSNLLVWNLFLSFLTGSYLLVKVSAIKQRLSRLSK